MKKIVGASCLLFMIIIYLYHINYCIKPSFRTPDAGSLMLVCQTGGPRQFWMRPERIFEELLKALQTKKSKITIFLSILSFPVKSNHFVAIFFDTCINISRTSYKLARPIRVEQPRPLRTWKRASCI